MIPRIPIRAALIAAGTVLLVVALLWHLWQRSRSEATRAKLGRTQAEATVQSGRDAIETMDNAADRETAIDATTRNNADDIRSAEGADAPVAVPARDAALRSLCRRAAYRGDPKCVQQPAAR